MYFPLAFPINRSKNDGRVNRAYRFPEDTQARADWSGFFWRDCQILARRRSFFCTFFPHFDVCYRLTSKARPEALHLHTRRTRETRTAGGKGLHARKPTYTSRESVSPVEPLESRLNFFGRRASRLLPRKNARPVNTNLAEPKVQKKKKKKKRRRRRKEKKP